MSEMKMSETLEADLEAAEKAFGDYEFGNGVEYVDSDEWAYTRPGNELSKRVWVETEQEDDGPNPRYELTFTVRMDRATGLVSEAYALDQKGQIWGSMPDRKMPESRYVVVLSCGFWTMDDELQLHPNSTSIHDSLIRASVFQSADQALAAFRAEAENFVGDMEPRSVTYEQADKDGWKRAWEEAGKVPETPVRGAVGFYRPDPGNGIKSPNIVLDVLGDKVRVLETPSGLAFTLGRSEWMSHSEMVAETDALPTNPRYAPGGPANEDLDRLIKDRRFTLSQVDKARLMVSDVLARHPAEASRKLPEARELAVEDLCVGDQVDLKSCPFLKGHAAADFEYAVVESIERETPGCIAVGYEDIDVVGYPVGTKLKVSPVTVANRKMLYEAQDGKTVELSLDMTVYQPSAEFMPTDITSADVFSSLNEGKSWYPSIPEDAWRSFKLGDVERAVIVDDGLFPSGSQAMKMPVKRIVAVFQPQAWINDYATDIDGREDVDVTEQVLRLPLERVRALQDYRDSTDVLVDGSAVTIEHDGPFTVKAVDSVCKYFGVKDLSDITESMLVAARQAVGKMPEVSEADLVEVKAAGFQIHQGTVADGEDLNGRWWWTLSQPGWSGVETALGAFNSDAEAWADAVRCLRSDPSLTGKLPETDAPVRDIELCILGAQTHGECDDPDHELGDLQDCLREMWALMTPEQQQTFMASESVRDRLEYNLPEEMFEAAYPEQDDEQSTSRPSPGM